MLPGEQQKSPVRCRRRPKHQPCAGEICIHRVDDELIEWTCTSCSDQGTISNWRSTQWDLAPRLKDGRVVSLAAVRAQRRRHGRPSPQDTYRAATLSPVYALTAELVGGPTGIDQRVSRSIRISGDHTLEDLHELFAAAFDRDPGDEYEFLFGAPYESGALRYLGGPTDLLEPAWSLEADSSTRPANVPLEQLELNESQTFGYLCEGDADWMHRITVGAIDNGARVAEIVAREGESPEFAEGDWQEEAEWEDETDPAILPLTELYGAYEAEHTPRADAWLALEELERMLLIVEAHTRDLPAGHGQLNSLLLHALVHERAETGLAKGDAWSTRFLNKDLAKGVSRHQAIHRLGHAQLKRELQGRPSGPS